MIAVSAARSWRQVLRSLGLYPDGPNHVIKREASRLGLDTSHFGVGLRCSDPELAAALSAAESWPQLLSALGLPAESRRGREAVRARAAELGYRTEHLGPACRPHHKPDPKLADLAPDCVHLRAAAESLAMAWLLLRDLWTAFPAEPRPYDLLLETSSGVARVQVKTTTRLGRWGTWQVGIGRHAGGGRAHDRRVPYTEAEVDQFLIIDGDLTIYLIPRAAVAGRVEICVGAYGCFAVGNAASLAAPVSARTDGIREPAYCPPVCLPAAEHPPVGAAPERPAADRQPPLADRVQRPVPHAAQSSWTPSELRTAAEKSKSWADMLRAFGYQPSSTRTRQALQRAVRRHGIVTSHFVGQRTWSDAALVAAVPVARTWADLCEALGLSPIDRQYKSVRAAASRLGLSLDHLTLGPRPGGDRIAIELPDQLSLSQLSSSAPRIATAWFLLCGVAVSIPAEPQSYDLIAQLSDGLCRVQVKSTTFRGRRGSWVVRVGHRPDGSPTRADFVAYDANEVDLFFIVDGDLLLYLIPRNATAGKTSLSLRSYTSFVVGDASSLLHDARPARVAR